MVHVIDIFNNFNISFELFCNVVKFSLLLDVFAIDCKSIVKCQPSKFEGSFSSILLLKYPPILECSKPIHHELNWRGLESF